MVVSPLGDLKISQSHSCWMWKGYITLKLDRRHIMESCDLTSNIVCVYIYMWHHAWGFIPVAQLLHCCIVLKRMQRAAPFLWGKQNAINGSPYQGKHGVNQIAVWMGYNSDMRETKCHKSSPILSYEIGHACIHGTMLTKWHLLWWLWHLVFHIRLADWQGARPMSSVRRKQLGVTIRPPGKPHIISIYIY